MVIGGSVGIPLELVGPSTQNASLVQMAMANSSRKDEAGKRHFDYNGVAQVYALRVRLMCASQVCIPYAYLMCASHVCIGEGSRPEILDLVLGGLGIQNLKFWIFS